MEVTSALLKRVRKKDEVAISELFYTISPTIMGIARKYTYSDFEADDILQESFMKILKNIKQFDPKKGQFKSWIHRITINEALQYLRKYINERMLFQEEIHEALLVEEELTEDTSGVEIMPMLDRLPVGKRTIFMLYAIDGYKHQEIADKLNISVGTSKSQYAKAKALVEEMFKVPALC